jgi:ATP sulfurylase
MTIDFGIYPSGQVLLRSLATYPRYSGPREAVFTMICRKNMGCSHFIVGRDHAGIGDYYQANEYRTLFNNLSDIGITPVFFEAIGYNPKTSSYQNLDEDDVLPISGTAVRDALLHGNTLPNWVVRDMVQEMLAAAIKFGQPVFYG